MSNQFDLSFQNKAVRMYLYLIVPAVVIQVCLTVFTDVPRIITVGVLAIPLMVYFGWLVNYRKRAKEK